MTTLRAHFDGKQVVLDEPMPAGVAPNTPVLIVVSSSTDHSNTPKGLFDAMASIQLDGSDLPPDFAAQHEHYVKGLPKR